MPTKKMRRIILSLCVLVSFIFYFVQITWADELSELRNELKAIQRKIEKLEAKKKADFHVYWKDGLRFVTEDKKFSAHIGGRIHLDSVWIKEDGDVKAEVGEPNDRVEFRRARLQADGTLYDNFFYKLQLDFAGGDADFRDAYIGMKGIPYIGTLRIGQFFEPISLENLTSTNYMTFLELGLPNAFTPGRNVGIGLQSNAFDESITWEAGLFRDADDFGDVASNEYNFTGRITGLPWYGDEGRKIFHVGASYSWRNPEETVSFSQRPEAHLANTFVDTGSFEAKNAHHLGYEVATVYGPISVQGELLHAYVNRKNADEVFFYGLYGYASYFLTGEHRPYSKTSGLFSRVRPKKNFSIKEKGVGAWELAARYSYLDLKDEDIDGGIMSDITIGLNWYLNPNMRVMTNYIHSNLNAVGEADIFAMRLQVDF